MIWVFGAGHFHEFRVYELAVCWLQILVNVAMFYVTVCGGYVFRQKLGSRGRRVRQALPAVITLTDCEVTC